MSKKEMEMQEFCALTGVQKIEASKQLVRDINAPLNGEMTELHGRISVFEKKFKITSEELISQLDEGERDEDREICDWLMLLDKKEYYEQLHIDTTSRD